MTIIRPDSHGPYVKVGGYVFRPLFPVGYDHAYPSETQMRPGQEVRARHRPGTPLGSLRRLEDEHKETWFAHGSYLDAEPSSEAHLKPAHENWSTR